MNKINNTKKSGFTFIEIIISLIISALIGIYILKQTQRSNFTSDVSQFVSTLVAMIQNGVLDTTVGYVSGNGDGCDGNGDFDGITADKVNQCAGWSAYEVSDSDDKNSYIYGKNLLGAYTSDGKGCKIYFDYDNNDTTIFYTFVDCSNLNYDDGNPRYKKYVEERIAFTLENSLSTIYQKTDENATAIDNDSGGNKQDGMIRVKFQK